MTLTDVSGPTLQKKVDKLKLWYAERRQFLMNRLSMEYPYGTVKLSPADQLVRFQEVQPQDFEALIAKLNDKYRGLPNATTLVNTDLANWVAHSMGLIASQDQTEAINNGPD